jgi:hypothetical protein
MELSGQLQTSAANPRRNSDLYVLSRILGGPRSRSGCFGVEKKSFGCVENQIVGHYVAWVCGSVVAEGTALLQCNAVSLGQWFPSFRWILFVRLSIEYKGPTIIWNIGDSSPTGHFITSQETWILSGAVVLQSCLVFCIFTVCVNSWHVYCPP